MQGSVIRIFLKDGKPDGLRTIELTLSTVLGTIFPRPSLEKFLESKSAQKPGVYILIGRDTDTNDSQMVYVGEGDPVGPRLKSHGVQKEFWTEAAVFTSKDEYLRPFGGRALALTKPVPTPFRSAPSSLLV